MTTRLPPTTLLATLFATLLATLFAVAGCGGSAVPPVDGDAGSSADADLIGPDGGPAVDADPAAPDADPAAPDADPAAPDAEPTTLDAGSPDATATALCGDGVLSAPEQCDDGNAAPFDGCSATCTLELVCSAPVAVLEIGVVATGSNISLMTTTSSTCGGSAAGEQLFVFTLYERALARLSTDLAGTTFDTALYLRSDCSDTSTEIGCAAGGMLGDTLNLTLDPGTYFAFVDGRAGATGDFELLLTVLDILGPGAPCDPTGTTDLCDSGFLCIDPSGGSSPVCTDPAAACESLATALATGTPTAGTTAGAADLATPSCATDGDAGDVTYTISVTGPVDIIATVVPTNSMFDAFEPALSIQSVCGDAAATLGCSDSAGVGGSETVTIDDADSGTYFVVVDGYMGAEGAYSIVVNLRHVRMLGDTCDPGGVTDRCVDPYACADDGAGMGTCMDPYAAICGDAPPILDEVPVTGTVAGGAVNELSAGCVGSGSGEAIYALELTGPGTVQVTATRSGSGGGSAAIYLRGAGTCSPDAEVSCDTGGTLAFTSPTLEAGIYYVVFDAAGGYTLTANVTLDLIGTLPPGATCDPASMTDRCALGGWCIGGTCQPVVSIADMSPNFSFCDAQGPTSSDFIVNGTMTGAMDGDNFELTLAAPASLYISTSNGFGGCSADTLITLYDSMGMICDALDAMTPAAIAQDSNSGPGDCSLLDPAVDGAVVDLPAGTYYIRVTHGGGGTGTYVLLVDIQ